MESLLSLLLWKWLENFKVISNMKACGMHVNQHISHLPWCLWVKKVNFVHFFGGVGRVDVIYDVY